MTKTEIAPGIFVGSKINDIKAEQKDLIKKLLDGDESVLPRLTELGDEYCKELMPKRIRRI